MITFQTVKRNMAMMLFIALALIVFSACGGSTNGSSGAGQSSGQGDQVAGMSLTDASSDRVEYEITTQDGDKMDLTATADIPDDFPLPVYPEWTLMGGVAKVDMGNGVRWNGSFQFEGEVSELAERYAEDLRNLGYEVAVSEVGPMIGLKLSGALEGNPVEGLVSIGAAGDKSVINISFGDPM